MSGQLLEPRLQELLGRTRLHLRSARPFGGVGERTSRALGTGLEFSEHRPYQAGDDLRHADPHLEARLGETYTRQYAVEQQLPVTILLDRSASMVHGTPDKFLFARKLAAALAYVALAGNDRVRLAAHTDGQLQWTEWFGSPRRVPEITSWLQALAGAGSSDPADLAVLAGAHLPTAGLVIIISDWLSTGNEAGPGAYAREGREVLAVHVYSPDEEDPGIADSLGDLRITDSETGEELEVSLGDEALSEYRQAWNDWRTRLQQELLGRRMLYLPARSDSSIETLLLRDWMGRGITGR